MDELKAEEGNYLLLTPNLPSWDPHTNLYQNQEYEMTDYNGNIMPNKRYRPENILIDRDEASRIDSFISSV